MHTQSAHASHISKRHTCPRTHCSQMCNVTTYRLKKIDIIIQEFGSQREADHLQINPSLELPDVCDCRWVHAGKLHCQLRRGSRLSSETRGVAGCELSQLVFILLQVIFITEYMSSGSLKQFLKKTKKNHKTMNVKVIFLHPLPNDKNSECYMCLCSRDAGIIRLTYLKLSLNFTVSILILDLH